MQRAIPLILIVLLTASRPVSAAPNEPTWWEMARADCHASVVGPYVLSDVISRHDGVPVDKVVDQHTNSAGWEVMDLHSGSRVYTFYASQAGCEAALKASTSPAKPSH